MNNLFTTTDYDYMIGRTIKEEQLNNERLYEYVNDDRLKKLRDELIQQINNNLLYYYLVCDEMTLREQKEKRR